MYVYDYKFEHSLWPKKSRYLTWWLRTIKYSNLMTAPSHIMTWFSQWNNCTVFEIRSWTGLLTYQLSSNILFVAPDWRWPLHLGSAVSQLLCFLLFFLLQDEFDNFIQWSCRICFGLFFPSCIFFFNWYLFTFNWPFNMLWKASSVTLPRPPWYSKVLSTHSFTNKQHRCIKILVVVFAEIYIMRMTSKTC